MMLKSESETQEEKFIKMTTEPVGSLVKSLALPAILSQMISSLYNLVDTMFVGRLSTEAVAAVGVCFPIMTIIQAFGFFFGQGSGNYISRVLGSHSFKDASTMATTGFFLSLCFGCVFAVLGFVFTPIIVMWIGATEEIFEETVSYLPFIAIGAPFILGASVINIQLRFQGNSMRSMVGILSGAVVNLILDPILIFGFKMGIRGAALSTLIGQFFSFGVLLFQARRYAVAVIHPKYFKVSAPLVGQIFNGGTPSIFRQGLMSMSSICLNSMASAFGVVAVAAFSAVSRVMQLAISTLNGIGQGFQPVCGFNYGAKLYKRVKDAFSFTIKLELLGCLMFSSVVIVFARLIISLFRKDPEVVRIGYMALRIQCCSLFFIPFVTVTSMMTQVMGKVVSATIMAMSRQGLFFIPAILILPEVLGLTGILLAQPVSDFCAFCVAMTVMSRIFKELKV